jgi:hypothetical protein
MNIITGYTGRSDHVTANADQGLHQGIFGRGSYVLDVGQKFAATMPDATTVTLADGEGVLQGVHFRIEPGTTESISISPGTTGYNRIDLIVARYTKDVVTGIEAVNLAVIEGTPTTGAAAEPTYTEGDVLAGGTLADFPMFRVTLTGLTPVVSNAFEECGFLHYKGRIGGDHGVSGDLSSSNGKTISGTAFTLKGGYMYFIDVSCQMTGNAAVEGSNVLTEFIIKNGDIKIFSQKFYAPDPIQQTRGTFVFYPTEDVTLQASATTAEAFYGSWPVAMVVRVYAIA